MPSLRDFAVSPISPAAFTVAMTRRWTDLRNSTSAPLEQIWCSMATAFGDAITTRDKLWRVLRPQTGTGKTQGLCVYAALMIIENLVSPAQIGVLIVTPTISQANEIVDTIRSFIPENIAARVQTRHSENAASPFAIEIADVFVVTHAAYILGLKERQAQVYGRWENYAIRAHGPRLLTVIDEALSGLVEEHQLTAKQVERVITCMDGDLRLQFPKEFEILRTISDGLHVIGIDAARARAKNKHAIRDEVIWTPDGKGLPAFPCSGDMTALRKAMRPLLYDQILHGKESTADRAREAMRVDKTLSNCDSMITRWCYSHQRGPDATLNSSQLLFPPDLPGPVVFDATASQHPVWELLGSRAVLLPSPRDARNYRNVCLHVAREPRGLGKGKMKESAKTRIPRLLAELERQLLPDSKVLLCVHKDIKHIALNWKPSFAAFAVAHWGDLDGKNNWVDYDTVIIVGMFYRDDVGFTNEFSALQGPQNNEWLHDPIWGSCPNVHQEMQRKHLAASVIQAINRVRCRRVIDADGNCPKTDAYIVLLAGAEGDAILGSVQEEMPGLVVKPWAFELDGPQQRIRKGTSQAAFLTLIQNKPPGEYKMFDLKKELSLNESAYADLMKVLRDDTHPLPKALAEFNAYFVSAGRGSRSRIWKR